MLVEIREERTLSMDDIVTRLRAAGMCAYVENSGGGCATIYASRHCDTYGAPFILKDAAGDPIAELAAGPGWFDPQLGGDPGIVCHSFASTDDFGFCPDGDDDVARWQTATATETEETFAERMLQFLRALA